MSETKTPGRRKVTHNTDYWYFLCNEISDFHTKLEYVHRMTDEGLLPNKDQPTEKQLEQYEYLVRRIRETVNYALENSRDREHKLNRRRNHENK